MKTPRHFCAFLLFLSNAAPVLFAQTATPNQIPELEQKLAAATAPAEQAELCNELAFAALKKDIDRSISYADRALGYAREAGAHRESLKALNLRRDALLRKNDTNAAEKAYKKALSLLKTAPDPELEGRTRHNLGKLAQTRGDASSAIRFYEQAFTIRERIGDKKGLGGTVNNLGILYGSSDLVKSNFYYEKSIQLKKEAGDWPGVALTQANLANNYTDMGRLDRAQQLLDSAIVTNLALDNKNSLAICYQKLGVIQAHLGHYDEAIAFFEKSKTMFEAIGDVVSAVRHGNNLGQVYSSKGEYAKAMECYLAVLKTQPLPPDVYFVVFKGIADVKGYQHFNQEALEYCEKALAAAQTVADKANVLGSRAETEYILKQYDKAEASARTGLAFAKKAGVPQMQATCLLQLSNAHLMLGKLSESLTEVREVIAIGKKIKSSILPAAYTLQGLIYTTMGGENKVLALEDAQKALALAQKQGATEGVIGAIWLFLMLTKALGKTDEAVETLKRAEALKDSLYSSENTRDIARMEKDADFEKERAEDRLEQAQKDVAAAAELERQKSTRNGLLGGLLVVLALGAAAFYAFRKRQRLRAEQREAETRQRIARDLHDEVGSTLGAISILSQSAFYGLPKDLDKARFGNIGDKARAALDSISDIAWSVNPENDSMAKTLTRMSTFASEILEPIGVELRFQVGEGVESLALTMEKRKDFYLIFKEAIHNCAKYARAKQVDVSFKKNDNVLILLVKDGGIGFQIKDPASGMHQLGGNGLRNMRNRAAGIGGSLTVTSEPGIGTEIRFTLPL